MGSFLASNEKRISGRFALQFCNPKEKTASTEFVYACSACIAALMAWCGYKDWILGVRKFRIDTLRCRAAFAAQLRNHRNACASKVHFIKQNSAPFFCCTWPRARRLLLLLFVGDFRAASSDRSEAHGTEANDSPVQRACLATRCGRSCPMGEGCSSESRNRDR